MSARSKAIATAVFDLGIIAAVPLPTDAAVKGRNSPTDVAPHETVTGAHGSSRATRRRSDRRATTRTGAGRSACGDGHGDCAAMRTSPPTPLRPARRCVVGRSGVSSGAGNIGNICSPNLPRVDLGFEKPPLT